MSIAQPTKADVRAISTLHDWAAPVAPVLLAVAYALGIVVDRVGKHHSFKRIGRVPLGSHGRSTLHLRWNLRVNGKRLHPGRYRITLRALERWVEGRGIAVEVGVGSGAYTSWLAARRFDIHLVDISTRLLAAATERVRSEHREQRIRAGPTRFVDRAARHERPRPLRHRVGSVIGKVDVGRAVHRHAVREI